jgi:hypothetical protein
MNKEDYKKIAIIWIVGCMVGILSAAYCYEQLRHYGFSNQIDVIGYFSFSNSYYLALQYSYLIGISLTFVTIGLGVLFKNKISFGEEANKLWFTNLLISFIFSMAISVNSSKFIGFIFFLIFIILVIFESLIIKIQKIRQPKTANLYIYLFQIVLAFSVPLALYRISAATGWQSSGGLFIPLPWLNWLILILLELFIVFLLVKSKLSINPQATLSTLLIDLVLIPSIIFLLLIQVNGVFDLGGDNFHSGENLAPLTLALNGYWPWKDFLFFHGIWEDFLVRYIPAMVWEPNADNTDYVLTEQIGQGQIGFTWDKSVLTTNEPKPEIIAQPITTGMQTL